MFAQPANGSCISWNKLKHVLGGVIFTHPPSLVGANLLVNTHTQLLKLILWPGVWPLSHEYTENTQTSYESSARADRQNAKRASRSTTQVDLAFQIPFATSTPSCHLLCTMPGAALVQVRPAVRLPFSPTACILRCSCSQSLPR